MSQPGVQPDRLVWIINQFLSLNITVQVDGGNLTCQPKAALTPELRAAIRQAKPLLVALLGMSSPSVQSAPATTPMRPDRFWWSGATRRLNATDSFDPANRRCGTCRYHDRDGLLNSDRGSADHTSGIRGFCRRATPIAIRVPYVLEPEEEKDRKPWDFLVTHSWPETKDDEWCGEWALVELPPYHCWFCRHPLLDHTIAPVTCEDGCDPKVLHSGPHGPLRCWCYCEVPTPAADQKGVAA